MKSCLSIPRFSSRCRRALDTTLTLLLAILTPTLASPSLAEEADTVLAPRQPLPKVQVEAEPLPPELPDLGGEPPYRLIVKFRDDVLARSHRGALVSEVADLGNSQQLAKSLGMSFSPLIRIPEETLKELQARAAARSQTAQPDLAGLMVVTLPAAEVAALEVAGNALQTLPEVEFAYLQTLFDPPPGDVAPPTADHVDRQTYRGPDPGIDSDYANSQGWTGEGVRLSDCEFGWRYDHEDLVDKNLHPEPGQTIHPSVAAQGFDEHGTAVLGMTSAVVNGYGMSGMVPDAEVYTYPERTVEQGNRRVTAITQALCDSAAGDVVLLEMQNGGGPAERDPAVWIAVKTGTDAGIVVVGAAGNGNLDLDSPRFEDYRSRGDSGAILVGAGTPDIQHDKIPSSTFGSPVHLQGWGFDVATLGYGDLATYGDDVNQRYSATFANTSAAAPMVAAAAVILQQASGKSLAPTELRQLLIDTGVPQGTGGHIGPLVDLEAALDQLHPTQPTAHFAASCSGLQCLFASSAPPDDGSIVSHLWTFPGGATATGETAAYFFPGYGSHTVSLTVTDDQGTSNTVSQEVHLGNEPQTTPVYGLWNNPNRAGHEIALYRNEAGDHVLFWFTYTPDGTPIWYLSDAGPKTLSSWSQPLYRMSWDGSSVTSTPVGSVALVFSDPQNAWFSWTLDGQSGGEPFRLSVGGSDRTGSWYAPAEPGWGIQTAEQGGLLVTMVAFYDGAQPRWVQGRGASGDDVTQALSWLTGVGLCPSCSGGSSTPPPGQPAGSLQLALPAQGSVGTVSTSITVPTGGRWNRTDLSISRLAGAL